MCDKAFDVKWLFICLCVCIFIYRITAVVFQNETIQLIKFMDTTYGIEKITSSGSLIKCFVRNGDTLRDRDKLDN